MAYTIKIRRGTSSEWTITNPVLAIAEPGLETDTTKIKYGDGTTAWNSLAYANVGAISTITDDLNMTGHIIPTVDSNGTTGYDLGSPSFKWRDLYLSQGSLYIDGQKVIESNSGTIVVQADVDQSLTSKVSGTGVLTLESATTVNVASTLQMQTGFKITDQSGTAVVFGDKVDMDNNQMINLGAPTAAGHATTKGYVDQEITNLINGAPGALDTLNELANALGDDSDYAATITTALATKLANVVDDTTPQLGGNLDAQAFDITTTGKMLYSNVYATTGDLPSASTYHGMFAHVHAEGAGYFAHSGNWVRLANQSEVSGGGASVELSDTAPVTPSAGDLWFDSTDGSLNVYYNDGSSSQWVSTSGPAGATGPAGSSYSDSDVGSYLNGNLSNHIIPDSHDTYDIGSAAYKIRDLYVSDNSIHIGDSTLRNLEGSLLINGEDVMDYNNFINTPPAETITLATLKSEVAASVDFADFQARIAGL